MSRCHWLLLGACLAASAWAAEEDRRKVIVREKGTAKGIQCDIYRYAPAGNTAPLWAATTDAHGGGLLPDTGEKGEEFRPVSYRYSPTEPLRCPVTAPGPQQMWMTEDATNVQSKRDFENGMLFRWLNKHGLAVFFFDQSRQHSPGEADQKNATRQMARELATVFGVTNEFILPGPEWLTAETFTKRLRNWQERQAIKVTGKVDEPTLLALARPEVATLRGVLREEVIAAFPKLKPPDGVAAASVPSPPNQPH